MKRLDWNHLKKTFYEIKFIRAAVLSVAFISSNTPHLFSNPQNPTVVSGSATFHSPTSSTFQINAINNTIINWSDFSIDPGEITSFLQTDSKATVLNRVTGNKLSTILGTLQSNGNVYLINQNGILIGNGALINTGGFLASTLDVLDSDFLNGKDLPFSGSNKTGIVNLGTIKSSAGDVVLLGYSIDNQGTITASQGGAHLFAGSQLILQVNGPEKIIIQPKASTEIKDGTGIHNSGTIDAVVAELKVDGNPYLYGINHEGQINATGIVSQNGKVYLRAETGSTIIAGQTTAKNNDSTGGEITILGDHIALEDHSVTDVSGKLGGGTILIGGGYQGNDPDLPNAHQVVIKENAHIKADALVAGDGGTIIHWSDGDMFHFGQDSAKGGNYAGNGGFVETSGKAFLDYQGFANLSAPKGNPGTLLLDPTNLIISSTATSNVTGSTPFYPNTPGTTGFLSFTTLGAALASGNVIVQTGQDGGTGSGDITWNGILDLSMATTHDLTLNSTNNIIFTNSAQYYNSAGDLNLIAAKNIELLGGPASGSFLFLNVVGNINLTSTFGDILAIAGTQPDTYVQINAHLDMNIVAETGTLKAIGGSAATGFNPVIISPGNNLSITTGEDCILLGGIGSNSNVLFQGSGEVNLNIGGNCQLIAQQPQTFCNSVIGGGIINASIGNDLLLQGGFADSNYAAILSNKDISLDIGGNLLMNAGQSTNTFTQIGSNFGNSTNNISISLHGGSVILDSRNADQNSYSVIGHGNFIFPLNGNVGGNINISGGGSGANLSFYGSPSFFTPFNGAFAQIGHFQGLNQSGLQPISGNITVSGFENISLYPNFSYALIGHGLSNISQTTNTVSSISGDISLYDITGSISLNPGATSNAFAQIGHINATTTTGNITVNTTGNINLVPGDFADAKSIIGYGNFFSPSPSSYISKIIVSGENIHLSGGAVAHSNAIIGFETGLSSGSGQCSISNSTINVTANHDILLEGGQGSASNGSSIIGFFGNTNSSASSTIDMISVTSNNGNLSLIGGTNTSFPNDADGCAIIGTTSASSVTSVPTSNIDIKANNGTLYMYGGPQNQNTTSGFAGIINSANTPAQNTLDLSAGNIYLQGGISNPVGGEVFISSGNNLNITSLFDLKINGSNSKASIYGLGGVSTFVIGQDLMLTGGNTNAPALIGSSFQSIPISTTFSIGRDLQLLGGPGQGSFAQIGYQNPVNNGINSSISDLTFTYVGANVLMKGGTANSSSYALIGHGNGTDNTVTSLNGKILFENIGNNVTGGNVSLMGGTNIETFAQIGHYGQANSANPLTISGDIKLLKVGGSVNLTGGSAAGSPAIIGHGSQINQFQSSNFNGEVVVNAESVALNAGQGTSTDAIIGYALSSGSNSTTITSSLIQVTSNGPVSLTANNDSNAVIGYFKTTSTNDTVKIDNINVTANGGNVTLNGGTRGITSGGFALIGALTSSGSTSSSIKITTPFDTILNVGNQKTGFALIANNSNIDSYDGNLVRIDPARIILLSGSGLASIFSSGDLELNFSDALNINYDASNPSTLQQNYAVVQANGDVRINTSTPSYGDIVLLGTGTSGISATTISAGQDLIIGTPTQVGAGDISVGRSDALSSSRILANGGDLLITLTGDLTIQGGSLSGSASLIGDNITITSGGSISLKDSGAAASITSNGDGDISLIAARDFSGSGIGELSAPGGGNISTLAGRDITLTNFFSFNGNGASVMSFNAGRNISLSNSAKTILNSSGKLTMSAGDITLNDMAMVNMSGTGDLYLTANRHMFINDNSMVLTSGGNLNLIVDNTSDDPEFYGRGKLVKGVNAVINAGGGATRIFTSTQPFNSISGLINGVPFVPGIQFANTPQEQWGLYYETAFNGLPFTVFYKNTGTPIFPPPPQPRPPHHDIQEFRIALFEALQEWRTLDELHLVPLQFCISDYIADSARELKCAPIPCENCYPILRREFVTYNTKKLITPTNASPDSI